MGAVALGALAGVMAERREQLGARAMRRGGKPLAGVKIGGRSWLELAWWSMSVRGVGNLA